MLNFVDLKRQFDPLFFYQHPETFCAFAEVHCLPLPTLLTSKKTGERYVARYLTKEFWLSVIRSADCSLELPAEKQFARIADATVKTLCDPDDDEEIITETVNALDREISDALINEKLSELSRLLGEPDASKKALPFLAICELSEILPSQVDASRWKEETPSTATPKPQEMGVSSAAQSAGASEQPQSNSAIEFFHYENDVYLTAGTYVYRFWYHDENALSKGSRIKTVRIAAKGSANQYASVKIELYSPETKALVQTIILKKDEYRYCNAVDGKIIKFLPVASISDDLCMMREALGSSNLFIQPRNAEAWTLNVDGVSSFAVGGNDRGFLMVQGGKINSQFFKPAEDYFYKLRLGMVPLPVVEAAVKDDQYFLLMEDGSVFTNAKEPMPVGRVSLTKANRCPLPRVNGREFAEAALSSSQKSLTVFEGVASQTPVFFDGDGRRFDVKERNGCLDISC